MTKSIREIAEVGEWEISKSNLQIAEIIGKGSFGCVHSAIWRGTPVAVKLLPNEFVSVECMPEFRTELDTLSRLHHPNIVQLLGACTINAPYMIVMEHLPYTLETHIHLLSNEEKKSIAIDVVRGIAYMHNRSPDYIIHRDLKPSNILLTNSKKAKLADFGISMLQKDKTLMYNMTGETGSYRYMAPEVMRHESYNYQVDIWAIGMLLYFLFEEIPYYTLTQTMLLRKISNYETPEFYTCKNKQIRRICTNCWLVPTMRPDSLELLPMIDAISFETSKKKSKFLCW